ncbi:MAG: hypothetical protein PHD54_01460 [Desulfuromonadaceae bacterium]|nr:hypothetical protein [Desulfuromonadaceae bacterium]
MTNYRPMAELPEASGYKAGDYLVLVGELFGRGYANGLVEEARRIGMNVIGTTMGRRGGDGELRPLNAYELAEAEALLGAQIVNVPLEAGFDMETIDGQASIADQLKSVRSDTWDQIRFSDASIESASRAGTLRFRKNLSQVVSELEKIIPAGSNVLFSYVMAGGFPRSRIFMLLLNRVFKGTGDKYLSSRLLWESGIGRLCEASFNEVSADTFRYLLEETSSFRDRIAGSGGRVRYTAYGYHGSSVLVGGEYRWQSYIPYMPGWAKMRLEDIAEEAFNKGIMASVYNCPEIQTNSSALFLGVEISLYPLLDAIRREAGEQTATKVEACCQAMLKPGETVAHLLERADSYLSSPILGQIIDFTTWPQHNSREQAELMLASSSELMGMHTDQKQLICAELSRIVFLSTGRLMLHASWKPAAPVIWLNHDIIGRLLADSRGEGIV